MARRTAARGIEAAPDPPQEKKIYSSKYALSGILFCGMCGAPYRRCTWRRNGKTRIVWRCQNRLKNGTKFCTDSPTIEESDLHQALITAINKMLHQQEYLLAPFDEPGITERHQVLAAQQAQIDANMVDLIAQCADSQEWDCNLEPFRNLMEKRRKCPQADNQLSYQLRSYHDGMVRCIIERVTVLDTDRIQVAFKGGASIEQFI